MKTAFPIDPRLEAYLKQRYRFNAVGFASMWGVACDWVEERVIITYPRPPAFEAAAFQYFLSCLADNAPDREALRFSAYELIAPFARY